MLLLPLPLLLSSSSSPLLLLALSLCLLLLTPHAACSAAAATASARSARYARTPFEQPPTLASFSSAATYASIYLADSSPTGNWSFVIKPGVQDPNAIAYGAFEDRMNTTGWMLIHLSSNSDFGDLLQMYALGYLEAFFTAPQIEQAVLNYMDTVFPSSQPNATLLVEKVGAFLMEQFQWMETQYAQNKNEPYWQNAYGWYQQFMGMAAGFQAVLAAADSDRDSPSSSVSLQMLAIWAAYGDVIDISKAVVSMEDRPQPSKMDSATLAAFLRNGGHCSALVAVAPDFSVLYAGHNTWAYYAQMLRLYKIIAYNLNNPLMKARTISFSSMPGLISSVDDYLLAVDSQLVIMETTNQVMNMSLYDLVSPHALLSWQRTMIATTLASSAREWTAVFSKFASGTYTNTWIVVDMDLFEPFQPLPASDLVWIVEEYPGATSALDVTNVVRLGHFPSFNMPYQRSVWEAMGYPQMWEQTHSTEFTWDLKMRSQIFRRDVHKATAQGDESFGSLLQYNDFLHDPLARGQANGALSARYDLFADSSMRSAFGGIDTKFTSSALARQGLTIAYSGPTFQQQPVFDFDVYERVSGQAVAHRGMPNRWDFDWQQF